MNETVSFERSHSIVVAAEPAAVLDYVSNPNSWLEWMVSSHHIEADDRPHRSGDGFRELWHTRTGEVELNWRVTDGEPGRFWVGEAETAFIGRIVVRYDVEPVDGGTRFTRTLRNPARPKPPSDDMIRRMDEEAEICLANIKRQVEARTAA